MCALGLCPNISALSETSDTRLERLIVKFTNWRDDFREHEQFRACANIAVEDLTALRAAWQEVQHD